MNDTTPRIDHTLELFRKYAVISQHLGSALARNNDSFVNLSRAGGAGISWSASPVTLSKHYIGQSCKRSDGPSTLVGAFSVG